MPKDLLNEVRKDIETTHKHRDGIPQIAIGVFLIIAMGQLAVRNSPIMVAFIGIIPMIIEAMRKRITYPRIGYAKLREPSKLRQITSILVALIIALLIIGFVVFGHKPTSPQQSMLVRTIAVILIGLAMASIAVVRYIRERNIDSIWEFAFVIALLALVIMGRMSKDNLIYVVYGFGLFNLAVGIIRLYRFVKKYPVIKDE